MVVTSESSELYGPKLNQSFAWTSFETLLFIDGRSWNAIHLSPGLFQTDCEPIFGHTRYGRSVEWIWKRCLVTDLCDSVLLWLTIMHLNFRNNIHKILFIKFCFYVYAFKKVHVVLELCESHLINFSGVFIIAESVFYT